MTDLSLLRPDDWHLHLRDGERMRAVLPDTAARFARAIVMPNLRPPVTTTQAALDYLNLGVKLQYEVSPRIRAFFRGGYFREERDNGKVSTFTANSFAGFGGALAYLIDRLKKIDEGGKSLLDSCMLIGGSNLFDGDKHEADYLGKCHCLHGRVPLNAPRSESDYARETVRLQSTASPCRSRPFVVRSAAREQEATAHGIRGPQG